MPIEKPKTLTILFKGTRPLIMNNGLSADASDPRPLPKFLQTPEHKLFRTARKAWGKPKNESEIVRKNKLQFFQSLYLNKKNQIVVPAENLDRMLKDCASGERIGKLFLTKLVQEATDFVGDAVLQFPNMKKPLESLYQEHSYSVLVRVTTSRVVGTRAIFPEWSFKATLEYLPALIDVSSIKMCLDKGYKGLMDRRPKFGRFTYKIL